MRGVNERSQEYKEPHATISVGFNKCHNKAEEITIAQGKAILTKEELEKKRQALSIYVETEDQKELWDLLQNSCKFLNELEKFVSKKSKVWSIFRDGSPENLTDYFLWEKDAKIIEIPATGGMIFLPDPDTIKILKTE